GRGESWRWWDRTGRAPAGRRSREPGGESRGSAGGAADRPAGSTSFDRRGGLAHAGIPRTVDCRIDGIVVHFNDSWEYTETEAMHRGRFVVGTCLLAWGLLGPAQAQYVNFESSQVHPIALTPSGGSLLVVNTPDALLEVFTVTPDGGLVPG